jgi:hypothetical protein
VYPELSGDVCAFQDDLLQGGNSFLTERALSSDDKVTQQLANHRARVAGVSPAYSCLPDCLRDFVDTYGSLAAWSLALPQNHRDTHILKYFQPNRSV